MNEMLILLPALMAGVLLGAMFFGGLWWTVRRGIVSKRPAAWFVGSMLLRMGLTLAGFYYIANGHWQRLLACLLGFAMVRFLITRFTRVDEKPTGLAGEGGHAA